MIPVNKLFTFLLITSVLFAFSVSSINAQLVDAPDVNAETAKCFQSIIETDDLYCALRYNLPVQTDDDVTPTSPEEWCQYLDIKDGCFSATSTDPVLPLFPETIEPGLVFVSFFDNCTSTGDCSSADLIDTGRVPRVGKSLAGVYIETGHTFTFGDSDVYGCIVTSTLLFSNATSDCVKVTWSTAANTQDAQREQLGQFFLDALLNLEILDSLGFNYYVENNKITAEGKELVLEALNVADRILDVFRTSAVSVNDEPFATATALSALQSTVAAQTPIALAEGTGELTGGDSTIGGLIATMFLGGVVFFVIFAYQKRKQASLSGANALIFPLSGFMTVMLWMAYSGQIDLSIIIVIGVIFSAAGIVTIGKKIFGQ